VAEHSVLSVILQQLVGFIVGLGWLGCVGGLFSGTRDVPPGDVHISEGVE